MQADNGYANFLKAQVLIDSVKRLNENNVQDYYELIYVIAGCLTEQKDLELFASFCIKLYNNGYQKSVEDHKDALAKQGLASKISF